MHWYDGVWAGLLVAGGVIEGWALRNKASGDTLSERTRVWFHTHTRPGRAVFALAWVAFSVWFLIHILDGPGSW